MSPSRFAISWLSSSVECEGCSLCTSSAVWGGGCDGFILDGGVLVNVLVLLVGGFLNGDELGLTKTSPLKPTRHPRSPLTYVFRLRSSRGWYRGRCRHRKTFQRMALSLDPFTPLRLREHPQAGGVLRTGGDVSCHWWRLTETSTIKKNAPILRLYRYLTFDSIQPGGCKA
jgi:hypothetical protein